MLEIKPQSYLWKLWQLRKVYLMKKILLRS
ncbi:hypothetical protein MTR67_026190 [Solanum verrucosum]|uniref:Uncharacterized protein n=1 Tax=Solanum verrucosum TaxID=315347 RepID=A0AAF0R506_SOLVR|nr:hypothetical protein MTR67_026190 [Solanum verrucosum]